MATLTVTTSTDFRGGAVEANNTDIVFDTTAFSAATFDPGQFGPGLIANNVVITGDDQKNLVHVIFGPAGTFSAANWQFQNWGADDFVLINGTSGSDTITGSSRNDNITSDGGVDHIDSGAGNDTVFLEASVSGTTIQGGTQEAGGVDALEIDGPGGTVDLRPLDIAGIERLDFIGANNQTIVVDGDQLRAGAITQVNISSLGTNALIVRDNLVDMSGVTFVNGIPPADTITIQGTSTVSNTLIGSGVRETIQGNLNSVDTITGGGGDHGD